MDPAIKVRHGFRGNVEMSVVVIKTLELCITLVPGSLGSFCLGVDLPRKAQLV
jgi:hypothetical protein